MTERHKEDLHDERNSERVAFYKRADRGEPMRWRDIGPDEVWNEAWEIATKKEREECAKLCDDISDELGKYDGSAAGLCTDKIRERLG